VTPLRQRMLEDSRFAITLRPRSRSICTPSRSLPNTLASHPISSAPSTFVDISCSDQRKEGIDVHLRADGLRTALLLYPYPSPTTGFALWKTAASALTGKTTRITPGPGLCLSMRSSSSAAFCSTCCLPDWSACDASASSPIASANANPVPHSARRGPTRSHRL
jgi:hypothetical protein